MIAIIQFCLGISIYIMLAVVVYKVTILWQIESGLRVTDVIKGGGVIFGTFWFIYLSFVFAVYLGTKFFNSQTSKVFILFGFITIPHLLLVLLVAYLLGIR